MKGLHKDTKNIYDPNGFDRNGFDKYTRTIYDPNGFDRKGFYKYTRTIYDLNGFDRNGNHIKTKDKYDPEGFDRNGLHKVTTTIYDPEGFDISGYDIHNNRKKSSKIKTGKAKSFKDQKGKGHVNLPIALSKIYTNNSSKELINSIKQLIDYLYDNKQITKKVYDILNKAITYK